ncbi:MAG: ATP-grasp domain-containing protein [Salibacteraceae bacterium]
MKIAIVTQKKWLTRLPKNEYSENVWLEDQLIVDAFESIGVKTIRVSWDDPSLNWSKFDALVLRAVWDCFERFPEFQDWLNKVNKQTQLINPFKTIQTNIDKRYLLDLKEKGITIAPTLFIEQNARKGLSEFVANSDWEELILKPVFSSCARHTYRFKWEEAEQFEGVFKTLIQNESMMLQEFQKNILTEGEVSLMFFGGKYSHAVLKRGKKGDFRVQDDFGGSVENFNPSQEAIVFANRCITACDELPVYARIDIFKDNKEAWCLGELELIEPELWFRNSQESAVRFAQSVTEKLTALKI